jgi:hypothetical protein
MSSRNWRKHAAWIAAAISAFLLAYVAYVHVLAASHRMSPDAKAFRDGFGERDSLSPSWSVRSQGELTHAVRAGVLSVHGSGKVGDQLVIASAPRRFDDGVVTLRFRVPSDEAVETFLGLEELSSGKTVKAAFVAGPTPFVHVGGDTSGAFRAMSTTEDTRVEAKVGEWRTLSLQFTPLYSMLTVSLDGRPLASTRLGWTQGAQARIIFGVKLRSDVQKADVEMESIALDTLDWSATRSFDETFSGEFLDVQRWMFQFPDPDFGKLDVRIDKGHGLALDGHMQSLVVDPALMFLLRSVPFPLKSLHLSAELWVEELEEASLFIGLMGASAWSAPDRVFDVGIGRRKAAADTNVAGGWTGDGAISVDRGEEIVLPRKISLAIVYDAQTGMGTASIEGKTSANHYLDLKPLDVVAMRVGAAAHAPGAKVKLHVRRVSVEMR